MSRRSQRQRTASNHAPSPYFSNSSSPTTDVGEKMDPSYQPPATAPSYVTPVGHNSGRMANLQDQPNRYNVRRPELTPGQSPPAPAQAAPATGPDPFNFGAQPAVARGSFNFNAPAARSAENPSGYVRPAGLPWPQTLEEAEANLASAFSGWNHEILASGYRSTPVDDNIYQPVVGWSPYDGYIVAGQWVPDRARLGGPGQGQGQQLEPVRSTTRPAAATAEAAPMSVSKPKRQGYALRGRNRDAVPAAVPAAGKKNARHSRNKGLKRSKRKSS